jgi:hypothetical protein
VEANMTAIDCHWNHNGTVLAAAGNTTDQVNVVQFFSAYGEVLTVPIFNFYTLYFFLLDITLNPLTVATSLSVRRFRVLNTTINIKDIL